MPQTHPRLLSLDVFRGLTVAAMILVTDPGTYAARYHPLGHADWNGANATDMIFPSFLFIIGVSITLSRTQTSTKILRRTVLLILLGLLVNAFPDFHWSTLRLPGILQHIALCYAPAALLYLYLPRRIRTPTLIALSAAILLSYWAALRFYPVPGIGPNHLDTFGSLPAYVDRRLFTIPHLWIWGITPGQGVTFDPDGLLVTLPSLTTTLLGLLAGDWLRATQTPARKATGMTLLGLVLILAANASAPWCVINKKIWTSSFTLLSDGVALLIFAALYALVDLLKAQRWTPPTLVFGTNAILAFVLSGILTTTLDRIHLGTKTLHQVGYTQVLALGLAPINASLLYAILIVALNVSALYPLYRRKIFLRL